jgi:hypothetical protein
MLHPHWNVADLAFIGPTLKSSSGSIPAVWLLSNQVQIATTSYQARCLASRVLNINFAMLNRVRKSSLCNACRMID